MNGRIRNGVISAAVAATMIAGGVPGVAFADESAGSLQTRLQSARARFDELALAAAEVGESLNDTRYELDQTRQGIDTLNKKVEVTQGVLDDARETLAGRVRANYRSGARSLVDMVMGCSTLEELENAIYYADKVAEQDANAIDAVKTAESQLQEQKGDLENLEREQVDLVAQQEQVAAELEESQRAQADYINSLDVQLRDELAKQRAAEMEAQKQMAAQALAAQQGPAPQAPGQAPQASGQTQGEQPKASGDSQTAPSSDAKPQEQKNQDVVPANTPSVEKSETSDTPATSATVENHIVTPAPTVSENETPAPAPAPVETEPVADVSNETADSANTSSENTASTSTSDDTRAAILAAAYSQLGVPYVYGAESPGEALDCSGFTQYCYSQAGIDIPHSSVGQAGMASTCDLDSLQAGDLVFWEGTASGSASGSHVAIYLGDGQIIHANGTEVAVGTLSNTWTSCGSIS